MPSAPLSSFALLGLQVLPHGVAHSPVYFFAFWAAAFVSLSLALAGLNVLSNIIGSDFELMNLGKEAVLAGVASAIEAVSVWLILAFASAALARAILIPLILVWLVYQVAHYDSWSRSDAFMLLISQGAIVFAGVSIVLGHFLLAILALGALLFFLALFANLTRNL